VTSFEVHDADRCYAGRRDRHQDEDRHQGRLRQDRQHQDRRDVRHQDHQDHRVRQCEEQSQYVGRQVHLGHQCEDHQVHLYEGHQDRQGRDDCQDQDGNQRHQDRGVRRQAQDGNQGELHQGQHDHLEEAEWVDQLPTLGPEEAEWVEHQERSDHEEACRLVACQEELTESTAQVALTASG
jgi:hypothetical protein